MRLAIRLTVLICCLVIGLGACPAEAKRVALVIGNASHLHSPKLKNPVNDATDVAEALTKLDFEVILKKDASFGDMGTALRDLSRAATGAEAAVVFFAGNGIEVGGRNFLIPVDAKLAKASDVDLEAISLDTVLAQLGEARLGLVILDACRDNPFPLSGATRGVHRGLPKGLASVEPDGRGLFIIYAAKAGAVAQDGAGRNSPFTEALLKHLPTPGLELRHLIVRVRADVIAATRGVQVPSYYDSFNGEFYFKAAR
jgi:uncharacterized caspase-like protein